MNIYYCSEKLDAEKNLGNGHKFMLMEVARFGVWTHYMETGNTDFDIEFPNHGSFSEPVCRWMFRSLLKGLKAMHDVDIIHRDVKPDNLLLTADGVLKVSIGCE